MRPKSVLRLIGLLLAVALVLMLARVDIGLASPSLLVAVGLLLAGAALLESE